jgi:DNA-binding winged helix-turn-helix (wHTH) protein/tetratricopeptide (TPR) repeat protein
MKQTIPLVFGKFRFDPPNECVWQGNVNLGLAPKSLAVLDYLLANRGRLVTKEELLEQVWSDSYVGDAVLKVCVREIRKALDDDPVSPRFIETVHRRGYRFIAPTQEIHRQPAATAINASAPSLLVGRDAALAHLGEWLDAAQHGRSHVVFITGDPGAGKTAIAEAFLQSLPNAVLVARGHALEQYGSGEAYMPVLEALTALCKSDRGSAIVRGLETHAPTWLAQMPSLVATVGQATLQRELLGATRERMLREMAEALERVTAEVPLVMLLEDLHWSDKSTIDLVAYIARRKAPARLLLIGTYRPVDVILAQHPLKAVKQELLLHGLCHEVALDFLREEDVREYLNRRFAPNDFEPALSRLIHSRTDGNPLFMVTEGEFLRNNGSIEEHEGRWKLQIPLEQIEVGMPKSLRDLIERQIDRISPELQTMLQVASIGGTTFSSSVIAFGMEISVAEAEEMCESLTRRGVFIRQRNVMELPDGTVATHYEFIHSLYQNVFYDIIPMGKRLRLHRRIGQGLEALYGSRVASIAAELALHFEEGREYVRAAVNLFLAAGTASRRYAHRETIAYLKKARILIGRLPEGAHVDLDLAALEQLGLMHRSIGDMRSAADDFNVMATLAKNNNRLDTATRALLYRASVLSWLDRNECLAVSEQAFQLSLQLEDELLRAHVRGYCAYWRFLYTEYRDEDMAASQQAIQTAERFGNKALLSLHVGRHAYFQCLNSNYDDSIRTADRGIALAIEVGDFFDHAMTQFFKGWALLHSGRWDELLLLIKEAEHLAERNEHYLWKTLFHLQLAWLHLLCGSLAEAETLCLKALEHVKQTGHPYTHLMASTLLGNVLLNQGEVDRGLQILVETSAAMTNQRVLMDWIWKMPLRLGLAGASLQKRNFKNAVEDAEWVLKTAEQPGEKTYMALASSMLAEIRYEEGSLAAAARHVATAIDLVEAYALPLAAERVFLVAAKIRQAQNKSKAAGECRNRAGAARKRLADSVRSSPLLQESMLRNDFEQRGRRRTSA